ncbi:MAG: aminoglycoside phosphotransferase family protein [Ostreibacterium sp.]
MKRKTVDEFLLAVLPNYRHLTRLEGDASTRCYFRARQDNISYIIMDAPTNVEVGLFVQVATAYAQASINVPEIIDMDLDNGYILLSDFGDETLQSPLTVDADKWLPICLERLLTLQKQGGQHLLELPEYGSELLLRELSLFPEWFVTELLGEKLSANEELLLRDLNQLLINSALSQSSVWVHRDYHCRNIMKVKENDVGIIDFQDSVLGPVTYDIVSLLKDCYIRYPKATVKTYLQQYYVQLVNAERYYQDFDQFERDFDLMGLQRHLKVLGLFSRLSLCDDKPTYLNDLPLVFDYILETLNKYSELRHYRSMFVRLAQRLENKILL